MDMQHVSLRINSTFHDMFGEYLVFIREVYPEVREICQNHGIEVTYDDVAFSVPEEQFSRSIILQDLRCIDADRTIFICFRGQKLGWRPCPADIDGLTLDEYPELVDYIGNVSITELAIMHALKPFDKCIDGHLTPLPPVKHDLFYFRNPGYLDEITNSQKSHYINQSNGRDKEVLDMEIAKAKDLIFETKEEFDEIDDGYHDIVIRPYDARWDCDLNIEEMMLEYTGEFEKLCGEPLDYFIWIHSESLPAEKQGGLKDFTCEGKPLKDIMVQDIINALKKEFPENFKD
ncbi:hypothetical protein [uncultured Methanobrevibacter sp.]|uniref:hypothetical protein n=1 Tax=uncultured Methanobrevibacter sp. TaxID=253161 RepID=UPI00262C3F1B|nr:hypothetical protein [uncultured Methanobrevibacter sp.]